VTSEHSLLVVEVAVHLNHVGCLFATRHDGNQLDRVDHVKPTASSTATGQMSVPISSMLLPMGICLAGCKILLLFLERYGSCSVKTGGQSICDPRTRRMNVAHLPS